MVKVGDTVKMVERDRGWCCARNLGRNGIVISVSNNYARVSFEGDDLPFKTDYGNIEALQVISNSPPEKITQNGYEYSLVGPVKPEWLVDGAWVVNTETGEKRLVKEERPGVFNLCIDGLASIRYYDGLRNQYRPHEPDDWKWGDWAMYDGEMVFVTGEWKYMGERNLIAVTHPSFTYTVGFTKGVSPSDLTPTF